MFLPIADTVWYGIVVQGIDRQEKDAIYNIKKVTHTREPNNPPNKRKQ